MYDQTIPFYLRRTTTLVAFRDELALGIDAEPHLQIPTARRPGSTRWQAPAESYAVLRAQALPTELADAGVPMRVLARDSRRVIVSRL